MEEQQYVLTHNRDESPGRSPDRLHTDQIAGQQLIFPKEPKAGGTWIASSNNDLTICILNGAFENHERTPPYRRSRGLVALDFFGYSSIQEFVGKYTFVGIEPFTLLVCEGKKLHELRWDSRKVHLNELDAQRPHIWSSAPLYRPEIRRKREQWFDLWLQLNPAPKLENIMYFHQNAGEGNPRTDVIMKKSENFRTVSITNVIRTPEQLKMRYRDLITESQHERSFPVTSLQSNMKGG
jgi:uncharacterized protein with NRDE domain